MWEFLTQTIVIYCQFGIMTKHFYPNGTITIKSYFMSRFCQSNCLGTYYVLLTYIFRYFLYNCPLDNASLWSGRIHHFSLKSTHMSFVRPHISHTYTSLQILFFRTRWIIKFCMISKNDGGIYITNWHIVSVLSACRSSIVFRSITLAEVVQRRKTTF